eukprot:12218314-Alexandrium_andersonii.AAC.1
MAGLREAWCGSISEESEQPVPSRHRFLPRPRPRCTSKPRYQGYAVLPNFRIAFRPPGFPSSRIRGCPETPSCSLELRGILSSLPLGGPPGYSTAGALLPSQLLGPELRLLVGPLRAPAFGLSSAACSSIPGGPRRAPLQHGG